MIRILFASCLLFINSALFSQTLIANGQMPNVDHNGGNVYLVYGRGDSILFSSSSDNGRNFSKETFVAAIPHLAASHTRGPQVAQTDNGTVITACNSMGDIFSFVLDTRGEVVAHTRVNDKDTTAKENLMALSADGTNVFAAWLDLRNGHNQIYGAASSDGGRTWSKNVQVYASPDTTVCECCKPSVVVKGSNVYVMFRNLLNGYRDMYIVQSGNHGTTFGHAQKLGIGSWKLSGCPMDGGGFYVDDSEAVHAVFKRDDGIYSCTLGELESRIGSGRSCTMDENNGLKVYAWVEKGYIIFSDSNGKKNTLGKGQLPVIRALSSNQAICMWEDDKKIMKALVDL